MKLLWWKVYLWLNIALIALAVIAEFSYPSAPPGLFIADVMIYSLALIGVYAFISKKPIFTTEFWKYLFWFNVVYSIAFLLYAINPEAPIISYVSNLSYGDEEYLFLTTVIGILLSIPYMYAIYQLSKGYFLEPKTKGKEESDSDTSRWGMVQTALWGYSIVFLSILILLSFVPSAASSGESGEFDFIYTTMIFSPILLFWLWIVFTYKRYAWNWWRVTLVLNSILFSALIVFGTLFYEPGAPTGESEFDIIGILQFLIIYAGLIVFGREQFTKQPSALKAATSKEK
jgi:hypothetical protein